MTTSRVGRGRRDTGNVPAVWTPSTPADGIVGPSKLAMLALVSVVVIVYLRTFGAGFVEFDDDIHVYANPFLNPLSIKSVVALRQQTYKGLYVPLAYTILAAIALFASGPAQVMSAGGHPVTLNPVAFHVASVSFHIAYTLLCWMLVLRLTGSRRAAMICSLVFAVHPLQAESVGWISELRGLSSGCFALAALNVLTVSRQLSGRAPRECLCGYTRGIGGIRGLLHAVQASRCGSAACRAYR